MKAICLILMLVQAPSGIETLKGAKEFPSLVECFLWKRQQEFIGPASPVLAEFLYCEERY